MKQQKQDVIQESLGNRQIIEAQLDLLIGAVAVQIQDKTYLQGLARTRDQLITIITAYSAKKAEINADRDLTSEAKLRRAKELEAGALEQINGIKDLSGRATQLEAQLFPQKDQRSDGERILQYLREQEIRQDLGTMDNMQVAAHLHELMEGDPENLLLDAAINCPNPLKSYISNEDRRVFLRKRAEYRSPALAQELSDVEEINGCIIGMKNVSRDHIS